jgi:hypothetical protein
MRYNALLCGCVFWGGLGGHGRRLVVMFAVSVGREEGAHWWCGQCGLWGVDAEKGKDTTKVGTGREVILWGFEALKSYMGE